MSDNIIKYKQRINRLLNRVNNTRIEIKQQESISRITKIRNHLNPKSKDYYYEMGKKIPVVENCDVLVVGGGPAGLSAAIGASKTKCSVILVERFGCFGGVITTVGMETLGWYRYEGTQDTEGIGREMERIAERMGGTVKWPYNDSRCLDADMFKIVADNLVMENNIKPILHCLAVDVIIDDNTITGVIFESKSGRMAIKAKCIVDATADADIAYLSNCSYTTEPLNSKMSVTPVFSCSSVDKDKFLDYTSKNIKTYKDWVGEWKQVTTGKEDQLKTPFLSNEFKIARDIGLIPDNIKTQNIGGTWSALTDAGEATNLNLVHLNGYDCTNVYDLTKAEMEGRLQSQYALKALKHLVPGFESSKLRNFSMTIGTRDSRKIVGEYNLTGFDVTNQARFRDAIGIFPEFLDGYNILIIPTSGRYFQVPLRCLIPKKINGLLVAGRCVSGDKVSHAAMRNMMACTVTGQGAGVAAAISAKLNVNVRDLDIKLIQIELKKQGVRIH